MNHLAGEPECIVGGFVWQSQAFYFICQHEPHKCSISEMYAIICIERVVCEYRICPCS